MFRNSYKSVGDGSEEEECKLGFRSLGMWPTNYNGGWKQVSEEEHGQNVWDYQKGSNCAEWLNYLLIPSSEPTKGFYFL